MPSLAKPRRLKKELTLLDVYAIATGTTLSAGFFLLPGLAARAAGPGFVLSYLIAALPMIPAMFCAAELATAMPRAGGAYYFVDRSLGPMMGTIAGVGTWLALVLKTTFALVGIGAYLDLFFPGVPVFPIAGGFAVFFGVVNLMGVRRSGRAQLGLVIGLLAILAWLLSYGATQIEVRNFAGFFDAGSDAILSTAGLVYVSYVGITKIASVSEEVREPEKSIPRGIFLALGTAVMVYGLGTCLMVGVVPMEELAGSLTPVALVAERLAGRPGVVLVAIAAALAFTSVANAGIMSASRYPLAMSRDHRLPGVFSSLGRRGTPLAATVFTVAFILVFLVALRPGQIAKLASSFQLFVFALLALAVVVMRESRIESYDPGYRSPGYPWLHLFGIAAPLWLVGEMGWLPVFFTVGVTGFGLGWYFYYVQHRVARRGAVYHVFERLGRDRFEGLDRELRGILKEKGLRDEDPFDEIIARAAILDFDRDVRFEKVVERAAALLAERVHCAASHLAEGFLKGTRIGATPVAGGAALPHLRLPDSPAPEMVLVRCQQGVRIDTGDVFGATQSTDRVFAVFFLVSPERDAGQHLRILAQLAGQIDQDGFLTAWMEADDESDLTSVVLRTDHSLTITVSRVGPTAGWVDRALRDLSFPEGCLVALIRREGTTLVPRGDSVLRERDRLTIIGSREGINRLRAQVSASP